MTDANLLLGRINANAPLGQNQAWRLDVRGAEQAISDHIGTPLHLWPDMGGSVPGGFGTKTTEVYQEGVRIPPVKLYDAGKLNEDILTILPANIRVAEERYGDHARAYVCRRGGHGQ